MAEIQPPLDSYQNSAARVVLAVITRPHGLQGAVRAKVFNPDTKALVPGTLLEVSTSNSNRSKTVTVLDARPAKETWVIALEGITSYEQADALRGAELSIDRAKLPPPDEDEVYHVDLLGCEVSNRAGERVGAVTEVLRYPSVDALVVQKPDGVIEVPLVDGIVVEIDLAARTVVVDLSMLE